MRFYKKNIDHADTNKTAFYLAPPKKPKGNVWYSKVVKLRGTRSTTHSVLPQLLDYFNQELMSSSSWIAQLQAIEVSAVFEPTKESVTIKRNPAMNDESASQIPPRDVKKETKEC